ncbi:hypothetical protein Desac_2603 [Desulfobacca acetoxidans DSM 11109]|uniref:Uncharacterized protein n=1 Tax=Desulfobacca acetoxidans (strain ATCC 700848 / DSM 11109 / ASRB2) TaxID=880072 RepID=F2NDS3_DESAR|nr:hypothetical protein Desac_2603 [Desulfobacca acetoxidans DSM 11109]
MIPDLRFLSCNRIWNEPHDGKYPLHRLEGLCYQKMIFMVGG